MVALGVVTTVKAQRRCPTVQARLPIEGFRLIEGIAILAHR
jgi:hypothetical protein